jgi:hypothetical protein
VRGNDPIQSLDSATRLSIFREGETFEAQDLAIPLQGFHFAVLNNSTKKLCFRASVRLKASNLAPFPDLIV